VPEATREHEVCFKCHGVRDATGPGIVRADAVRNIRLLVAPGNASSHPVTGPSTNPVSGGLEPGVVRGASLYCIDCHDNDEYTPGGTRPRGPHGSRYAPILSRNYETADPTIESFQAYALCYKCHNRDYLINDGARAFQHRVHVVTAQASCAVCHDAHGSRRNQRLVNFALTDRNGKPVVGPSLTKRRLEFVSTGPGRGTCYLTCHGKNHEPLSYP
jgi:predicted CXXCH cytochrome family protein